LGKTACKLYLKSVESVSFVGWVDARKPNKKQWEEGKIERRFRRI